MFAPVFVYPGAFHKSFFDPKDIKKEREEAKMRAIITVVGQDTVGILASVSRVCAEHNANVIEVTQSVLEELFVMVMLVNIDHLSGGINSLSFYPAGRQDGLYWQGNGASDSCDA